MKITEIENRTDNLLAGLLELWEKSVRTTHLFLSESDIQNIKKYVPAALKNVGQLIIATDSQNKPLAFMGIENNFLEMLFVLPEERQKGIGSALLKYGIEKYGIDELSVNEQNPQAKLFYEAMGFVTYKRTELDEQGNPFPILYMKKQKRPDFYQDAFNFIKVFEYIFLPHT